MQSLEHRPLSQDGSDPVQGVVVANGLVMGCREVILNWRKQPKPRFQSCRDRKLLCRFVVNRGRIDCGLRTSCRMTGLQGTAEIVARERSIVRWSTSVVQLIQSLFQRFHHPQWE